MDTDPVTVRPEDPMGDVAELFDRFNLLSLPVVDRRRRARGRHHGGRRGGLAARGRRARGGAHVRQWFEGRWRRLVVLAAVVGPGIITANVDNDAGGITTYSLAGAIYGYRLLWTVIPVALALFVVQEMSLTPRRRHRARDSPT